MGCSTVCLAEAANLDDDILKDRLRRAEEDARTFYHNGESNHNRSWVKLRPCSTTYRSPVSTLTKLRNCKRTGKPRRGKGVEIMMLTGVNAETAQSGIYHKRFRINNNAVGPLDFNQINCGNDQIHAPTKQYSKLFEVLRRDPNNADALFGLGEVYEKMGECIKAMECYQRFMKVVLPRKYYMKQGEERVQHLSRVIKAVFASM